MLDWLTTPKEPRNWPPDENTSHSVEVQGGPVFPVSRFRETPSPEPDGPQTGMDKGFPVSRFSRFENRGVPVRVAENEGADAGHDGDTVDRLPDLLDRLQTTLAADELGILRRNALTDPAVVMAACRLLLTPVDCPTAEDVAELDKLIVRLCELEPWLMRVQADMLAARRRMAPARVLDELASFRRWVEEAKARTPAAVLGRGGLTSRANGRVV